MPFVFDPMDPFPAGLIRLGEHHPLLKLYHYAEGLDQEMTDQVFFRKVSRRIRQLKRGHQWTCCGDRLTVKTGIHTGRRFLQARCRHCHLTTEIWNERIRSKIPVFK